MPRDEYIVTDVFSRMAFKEGMGEGEGAGASFYLFIFFSVIFCAYKLPCLMYKLDTDPGI